MSGRPGQDWGAGWLGFPPRRHFIVLPSSPNRAAIAGLALYDAVALHQQAALAVGRSLLRVRLGAVLSLRHRAPLPDRAWWLSWLEEIAPVVGNVGAAAFRLLGEGPEPDRFTCLLFDAAGSPIAFGKVWRLGGDLATQEQLISGLNRRPPATFGVPKLLHAGNHGGRSFLLQEPLPPGGHRRMRPDPVRLREVIAEVQVRLESGDTREPSHVPVHGSLTPLNLRQDRTGRLWLLDWDKVSEGPPRYDELRYWIGDVARRGRGSALRKARRVLMLLGPGDAGVLEALEWRVQVRPNEVLSAEQEIRDALVGLFRS